MSGLAEIGPGVLVLVGVFLIGLGGGVFLRRGGVRAARAQTQRVTEDLGAARARLAHTEQALRVAEREIESGRAAVAKHFAQTSDLFRDLTRQYTALYAHLAEGARELCPDQSIALGTGFGEPLLEAGPRREPRTDAESDDEPADERASQEEAEAQLAAVRRAAAQVESAQSPRGA